MCYGSYCTYEDSTGECTLKGYVPPYITNAKCVEETYDPILEEEWNENIILLSVE